MNKFNLEDSSKILGITTQTIKRYVVEFHDYLNIANLNEFDYFFDEEMLLKLKEINSRLKKDSYKNMRINLHTENNYQYDQSQQNPKQNKESRFGKIKKEYITYGSIITISTSIFAKVKSILTNEKKKLRKEQQERKKQLSDELSKFREELNQLKQSNIFKNYKIKIIAVYEKDDACFIHIAGTETLQNLGHLVDKNDMYETYGMKLGGGFGKDGEPIKFRIDSRKHTVSSVEVPPFYSKNETKESFTITEYNSTIILNAKKDELSEFIVHNVSVNPHYITIYFN